MVCLARCTSATLVQNNMAACALSAPDKRFAIQPEIVLTRHNSPDTVAAAFCRKCLTFPVTTQGHTGRQGAHHVLLVLLRATTPALTLPRCFGETVTTHVRPPLVLWVNLPARLLWIPQRVAVRRRRLTLSNALYRLLTPCSLGKAQPGT
jgi:hypothetical protein